MILPKAEQDDLTLRALRDSDVAASIRLLDALMAE
jgi:hypothetical protein